MGREGIRVAEVLDHPYSLIYALRGLARVHGARGDLDHATRLTAQGVEIARDRHQPQALAEASVDLGYLYVLSGRVAEGVALLEDALKAMEAMTYRRTRSLRARATLALGRPRRCKTAK